MPTLSMEREEKVARPDTAATVSVPDSVAPPGLLPMASVMLALDEVTELPNASVTRTLTAGEAKPPPATALCGCEAKASPTAAAGEMLKAAEVAVALAAEATRVYPVPTFWMLTAAKVATPAAAFTVVVPCRVS